MVGAKKSQKKVAAPEKGLATRSSGTLSKPMPSLTVGALERALLAEFPAADAEDGTARA